MLLVCRPTVCERSETIKTGLNNNHPASRGVYLSVMTCPFSHTAGRKITGLALVVMETLNIFFFFWSPLMLLAWSTTRRAPKKLEINTNSSQQTKLCCVGWPWLWFEIHLQYPCCCLKMHRIMGIKGGPICPA